MENSQGDESWVNIKYERLSDFCYECGKVGHTTQSCKEKVRMSETKMGHPMYSLWLVGSRPKKSQAKRGVREGDEERSLSI